MNILSFRTYFPPDWHCLEGNPLYAISPGMDLWPKSLLRALLGHFPGLLEFVLVPSTGFEQALSPVTHNADVGAEVVLLRGRREGEGVPLQLRDRWTLEEDILAHLHLEALLPHLQLQRFGWVHDHLQQEQRRGEERRGEGSMDAAFFKHVPGHGHVHQVNWDQIAPHFLK